MSLPNLKIPSLKVISALNQTRTFFCSEDWYKDDDKKP